MKDPIYLVLSAYDQYESSRVSTSAGYFLSRQEALDYCEKQAAQDYEDWKNSKQQSYHFDMENYLYPELIRQDDEHKLLAAIFGTSYPTNPDVPDISMEYYKEYQYPPVYKVQEVRSHTVLKKEHS